MDGKTTVHRGKELLEAGSALLLLFTDLRKLGPLLLLVESESDASGEAGQKRQIGRDCIDVANTQRKTAVLAPQPGHRHKQELSVAALLPQIGGVAVKTSAETVTDIVVPEAIGSRVTVEAGGRARHLRQPGKHLDGSGSHCSHVVRLSDEGLSGKKLAHDSRRKRRDRLHAGRLACQRRSLRPRCAGKQNVDRRQPIELLGLATASDLACT
jgi:hypothetical protein